MRIAFLGKGGSGKSTVAATVARLLARAGRPVLAVDVDTMPGLSFSLGLGSVGDAGLPDDLARCVPGKGWVIVGRRSAAHLVERYALRAPDDVRFLQIGKFPGGVSPAATCAFRFVLQSFRRRGWAIVGDLAAGVRQPAYGWSEFATHLAVVVEPTRASIVTAQRVRTLTQSRRSVEVGCILNKVRDPGRDAEMIREIGLPIWAVLPFDAAVAEAERDGLAPLDRAPASFAMQEIRSLVDRALSRSAFRSNA